MHWIIQDNLFREDGLEALLAGFRKLDITYDIVKVVPFSVDAPEEEQLIPNPAPVGNVMVCGSTTLALIASKRDWKPGSFLNSNHDYRVWKEHYGEYLLNADALVSRFADVQERNDDFFIRPVLDSKTFSGRIMSWSEYAEWRDKVLAVGEAYATDWFGRTLDADTIVSVSSLKTIYSETRFFVVDGKIAGKSIYKRGDKVVYDALVDDDAVAFAEKMIALWQPARAFVLDVGLTSDGYRIVEVNCINSAGFYAIDVLQFIDAIENMKFE